MSRLALACTVEGWAAWNVEYRRVGIGGGGGWPVTFADVAAAVDLLAEVAGVDIARVVTCGHSAGGHLALWLAARTNNGADLPGGPPAVALRGALALAGVADLESAAALGLGADAAQELLGGEPSVVPDRYRWASPARLLPLGVSQVLIHGTADSAVPSAMSKAYCAAAKSAGDVADYVELDGAGHRELTSATGRAWDVTAEHLRQLLA